MSGRVERYRLERHFVSLDFPGRPGQTVAVRATVYAPPDADMSDGPVISLPFHSEYTREEWEQVKRLADEAWAAWDDAHREGGRFQ